MALETLLASGQITKRKADRMQTLGESLADPVPVEPAACGKPPSPHRRRSDQTIVHTMRDGTFNASSP